MNHKEMNKRAKNQVRKVHFAHDPSPKRVSKFPSKSAPKSPIIRVEPVGKSVDRPYRLDCPFKKIDLTPKKLALSSVEPDSSELRIPQCYARTKPFLTSVEYFRNPCLDFDKRPDAGRCSVNPPPLNVVNVIGIEQGDDGCQLNLSATGLINVIDIPEAGIKRRSNAGGIVQSRNEAYEALKRDKKRVTVDEMNQTPPANYDKWFESRQTSVDSELAHTAKRERGVDSLLYDVYHHERKPIDRFLERNNQTHGSDNYLNGIAIAFAVDQIRKLALKVERELDRGDQKVYHMERFANGEERINHLTEEDFTGTIKVDLIFTMRVSFDRVAFVDWHPVREDVLAVACNSDSINERSRKPGFVLIWNMNNTKNAERMYKFTNRVSSLEFSKWAPYLLLVALFNGTIYVLNTSPRTSLAVDTLDDKETARYVVASNALGDRRRRVWSATWYNCSPDRRESFLCCKENGKIWRYTLTSSPHLEQRVLMKLPPIMHNLYNYPLAFNEKYLSLVAEDTRPGKGETFYIGTGEGKLHEFSSMESQFEYNVHNGTVSSFQCSPFLADMFLTGSSDGSIKVWLVRVPEPLFVLSKDRESDPIIKARWHPRLSTVIVSVSNAEIQLWDISQTKAKQPTFTRQMPRNQFVSDLGFSRNGVSFCVGDSTGMLSFFKVLTAPNLNYARESAEPQIDLLWRTLASSKLPRAAERYLKTLRLPYAPDDQADLRPNELEILRETYPTLIRNPLSDDPAIDHLEEWFGAGDGKMGQSGDPCLESLRKAECECDDECAEQLAQDRDVRRQKRLAEKVLKMW